jgi:hypothetical protein
MLTSRDKKSKSAKIVIVQAACRRLKSASETAKNLHKQATEMLRIATHPMPGGGLNGYQRTADSLPIR